MNMGELVLPMVLVPLSFGKPLHHFTPKMSRGNQRELARAKNAKKKAQEKKKAEGDPKKRLEAQAEIMRKKQAEGESLFFRSSHVDV